MRRAFVFRKPHFLRHSGHFHFDGFWFRPLRLRQMEIQYSILKLGFHFLHFDHIGGVDTLFYCLSNGSAIIVPRDRSPEAVCEAVQYSQPLVALTAR